MDTEDFIVTVLVPAAGRGARMGGIRKQYRRLGGQPLLVRTLRAFDNAPAVDFLIVAAPPDDVDSLTETLRRSDVRKLHAVVAGGASRQESVAAALEAAPEETAVVLVHDAVRPFVPSRCISAVIAEARRIGAAALAIPSTDTLRRGDGRMFEERVDREGLYRMQTPQAFRRDWLAEAQQAARAEGFQATDDVELVQRVGRPVAIVHGSPLNIKVTTPDDWTLAEALWPLLDQSPAAEA